MFNRSGVNEKFRAAIQQYCETMEYDNLQLTDEELLQLYTYVDSTPVSPEARDLDPSVPLHFEIRCSLARCYAFELILRGNQEFFQGHLNFKNKRDAHESFIKDQNPLVRLSRESFNLLLKDASYLTEDMKVSIRASCFLTINNTIKEILDKKGLVYPTDSETFLSWLIPELQKDPSLLPISSSLTEKQLVIMQKMFWPGAHFRHMLYTEGGDAMIRSLVEGVQQGAFSEMDFVAWTWRWQTNLFGFQIGRGAKCYDEEVHLLSLIAMDKISQCSFYDVSESYLDYYLLARAEKAGLTKKNNLTNSEVKLLGHLAAYFNQVNIVTRERGEFIYLGYQAYCREFPEASALAELYESHRKDQATITPTYVPAILNSAFLIFRDHLKCTEQQSIQQATQFMCQVLSSLYALPHDKRISCMALAKVENLIGMLSRWQDNHHAFEFALNEKDELMAKEAVAPRLSLRQ